MIDKIQVHYHQVEDRLALLVKLKQEQDIKLWLTRRVTQRLLGALDSLGEKDDAVVSQDTPQRKMHVQAFQKQQAAEKSQFAKEKIDLTDKVKLSDIELVMDVRLDNKTLRLPLTTGRTLNLEVSTQLSYILSNLLQSALNQTNWQISPESVNNNLDFTHQKYPTMTLN